MKLKAQVLVVGALLLGSCVLSTAGSVAGAANPLAGKSCSIYGYNAKVTVNRVTYTCVRVKGKLVWNAGVVQPAPPTLPAGNFDTTPGGAQIWSETFTGAAGAPVNSQYWTPVTGYGTYGTGEIENNTTSTSNLGLDGQGDLVITAKCVATTSPGCTATSQPMGQTWTSARIWTENKLNFQYGQLEARIWMPAGSFNWPAFWMMGQSYASNQPNTGWPYCGELDIAEGLQGNTTDQATIHSNINGTSTDWGEGSGLTQVAPLTGAAMTGGWHTYGILWKPNSIAYILDGKVWAMDTYNPTTKQVTQTTTTSSLTVGPGTAISSMGGNWPFNAPFFIIMNDAVGGVSSPVAASNSASASMKINWIHYYQYQGYGAATIPHH